jgi:ketosteroid isomerase-like protein
MSNDHWEISNLMARYAELLNLGQIDEVAELFRHGKITSEGNPTAREGTEEVAAMYRNSVRIPEKFPDTLIFTTNLQIEVDGDRATGKAYFLAMHQTERGVAPVIAGRYHDEFRKIDGTWWFHHRHMIPDLSGDLSTHLVRPLEELQDEARGAS